MEDGHLKKRLSGGRYAPAEVERVSELERSQRVPVTWREHTSLTRAEGRTRAEDL